MSEGFINRKSVGGSGSIGEMISATSTTSPLDSANGMLQGLTIFGKSEIVEGTIKSIGDNGLTVTTSNNDNTIVTNFNLTTALPLCSTTDGVYDELKIEGETAEVITRCKISNNTIIALEAPVVTQLTVEEMSAFRELRTFADKTNIVITDNPSYIITYLKNTDGGQVVANIQKDLQQQINDIGISGDDSGGDSGDEPILIFSAENGTENDINYTFNNNAKLSDFKTITVLLSTRGDLGNGLITFEENMINTNILSKHPRRLFTSYYQRYCDINFVETGFTQVRSAAPSENNGYILRIYYIYGIK